MKSALRLFAYLLLSALASVGHAQDARKVIEPLLPPVCTVLIATQSEPLNPAINDAPRIQQALNQCVAGQAVQLASNNEKTAFIAGPLSLPTGVSLRINAGVTLYASTDAALYDKGTHSCGSNGVKGRGCQAFISISDAQGGGVMGEGIIDGQGGQLVAGKPESWWQLARRAQKEKNEHNIPRLIEVTRSKDITLYRITLRNSPNFHVTLNRVDGFTAWGVRLDTPTDARNTDGIDPISSRNITIAHSYLRTGDDNIAIKAGNNGPTENISILHNHFYNGHGMSIGSETNGGVRNILVDGLSMEGSTSGLRIKSDVSRGGLVTNVRYQNVCLRNIRRPIDIDTRYNPRAQGDLIPQYLNITLDRVHSLTPGQVIMQGYDAQHPLQIDLQNVVFNGQPAQQIRHVNLRKDQTAVASSEVNSSMDFSGDAARRCEGQFVPFPVTKAPDSRPQLTADQARRYDYLEVLNTVGKAGQELVDPWDPMQDVLTKKGELPLDYLVDPAAKANGKMVFKQVQAAINQAVIDVRILALHAQHKARIYIQLKPGVYRELLYVPATEIPITLYSSDGNPANTRISASLHAALLGSAYVERFGAQFANLDASIQEMFDSLKGRPVVGTSGSAIAWIKSNGFQAKNITIENVYNKDEAAPGAECPNSTCGATAGTAPAVVVHHQAVALMLDGPDKAQFENVRVLGFQDTLYLKSPEIARTVRSFFNRSYIEGNVDFIFGDTTAYFYQTEIRSLGDRSTSYVTAPNTNYKTRYGFVFNQCRFTHDGSANALAGHFYLGRQWFHTQKCTPYGRVNTPGYSCTLGLQDGYAAPAGTVSKTVLETVGKSVILNSRIGAHINQTHPWSDWNKNGTLPYRPAQYSSDDYWRNLQNVHIDPAVQLGYSAQPVPADIYLAEFNNVYE